MIRILTIATGFFLWALAGTSQNVGIHIEGTDIVLTLSNRLSVAEQRKIINQFGMSGLSLDSLWEFGTLGRYTNEGWKVHKSAKGVIRIYKPVHELSGKLGKANAYLPHEMQNLIEQQTRATFGVNDFRKPSVLLLPNGLTRFYFEGLQRAGDIFLSGTFNEWSTLSTPMVRVDSGWIADVKLLPGKHQYKFIIDGQWVHDLSNKQQEEDGYDGYNSVYYVYNHEFVLKGFENAKQVIVTGNFVNWNERKLRMRKTINGWRLPVYIKDGVYSYKFIVDGNWMTDPANPTLRDDGQGNANSFLARGDTTLFKLTTATQARNVFIAGTFNNWNDRELPMTKTTSGWSIPYLLPPGNYQYKFIVDGQWMLDPQNPHTGELGGETNSVFCFKPNHTFTYTNSLRKAKEVKVAGNFNGWNGYTLKETANGWAIDVYLPPGKCLYKFIVDGEWMLDPQNKEWEQNEFGNGNSVLWIRNK